MFVLLTVIVFSMTQVWSADEKKENRSFRIPLIGEKAPSFTAESTNGTIVFPDDFGNSWKVLMSHPQDFSPVCSTELLELSYIQDELKALNVKLAVVSTDPLADHIQWKKALEDIFYEGKPTPKIKFPFIDDEALTIAKLYGMIHSATNSTKDVRGVFIIDPNNIIRSVQFYPLEVGRNSDELLRIVNALQATSSNKYMTPANWTSGNDLLIKVPPVTDQSTENVPAGFYKLAWFIWYEKQQKLPSDKE